MSDEIMEIEKSFAELLEESIKTLNTGDKVTGTVVAITPTEIQVDLGTKHAGYIPVSELTDDPTAKVEDLVKVGDEIETFCGPRQRPRGCCHPVQEAPGRGQGLGGDRDRP